MREGGDKKWKEKNVRVGEDEEGTGKKGRDKKEGEAVERGLEGKEEEEVRGKRDGWLKEG